ncbi:MAG: universal stress protein [Caldilineaceae bacterium]|nr:universal stress protein [Caldilineaceae bacterium]
MLTFKKILVPLDGSALSEKALPPALSLARQYDGQIILIRSEDFPSIILGMGEPEVGYWVVDAEAQMHKEVQSYLAAKADELRQQGYHVDTLQGRESPATEIIDAAKREKVDLIVMSTHGRGGVARWALGSVTDRVARHAPCPVLLVREFEE